MTKRQALQVLLQSTQSWARGAGCGLAERPSPERLKEIREAGERLWDDAYHFEIPRGWPVDTL